MKPHIDMSDGYWRVKHDDGTAMSDSIERAWRLYLDMAEKRRTGYFLPRPLSSLQFSSI